MRRRVPIRCRRRSREPAPRPVAYGMPATTHQLAHQFRIAPPSMLLDRTNQRIAWGRSTPEAGISEAPGFGGEPRRWLDSQPAMPARPIFSFLDEPGMLQDPEVARDRRPGEAARLRKLP